MERDFIIQFTKWSNMLVDYLSRLPAAEGSPPSIAAFDPFQPNLLELQLQDENICQLTAFKNTGQWPRQLKPT